MWTINLIKQQQQQQLLQLVSIFLLLSADSINCLDVFNAANVVILLCPNLQY